MMILLSLSGELCGDVKFLKSVSVFLLSSLLFSLSFIVAFANFALKASKLVFFGGSLVASSVIRLSLFSLYDPLLEMIGGGGVGGRSDVALDNGGDANGTGS